MVMKKMYGKNAPRVGVTPSICMINPKFPHNVGAAVRAASCFDVKQVWFTGNRVSLDDGQRLPREERMKGYNDVDLIQYDYPINAFEPGVVPVAIEVRQNSEILTSFEHPENAVYVFGPEDGSLPKSITRLCHRFVIIPTKHCANLSAAIYIVLYDRILKAGVNFELNECRGFVGQEVI